MIAESSIFLLAKSPHPASAGSSDSAMYSLLRYVSRRPGFIVRFGRVWGGMSLLASAASDRDPGGGLRRVWRGREEYDSIASAVRLVPLVGAVVPDDVLDVESETRGCEVGCEGNNEGGPAPIRVFVGE